MIPWAKAWLHKGGMDSASRVFSRLGILLCSSDGEWIRGWKVRSRARETRRARSPREPRPENLAGWLLAVADPQGLGTILCESNLPDPPRDVDPDSLVPSGSTPEIVCP
jgi:hypothetical protein